MPETWDSQLTPEAARRLLSGATPLREAMGVPVSELLQMAAVAHELWSQGRCQEADTLYRGIVALDASVPWGHAGLGLSALEAEDFPAAEAHLRRALAAGPDDPAIQVNLAASLLHLDHLADSLKMLVEVVEKHPQHPAALRAAAILNGLGHAAAELVKP